MTRVLLVDDEAAARDLLVRGLQRHGFTAQGAADGQAAVELLHLPWDVVITDLVMPRMDGIQLLAEMKIRGLTSLRVVITSFADKEKVVAVLNHGADYLLEKPFGTDRLIAVIRHLTQERTLAGQSLEQFFLRRLHGLPLTERERTLVIGILQGQGNKQIASTLGIGEQTVKNALSSLYLKLGIQGRNELFTLVFPV